MSGIQGFKNIGFPDRGVDADAVMKLLYANKHNLYMEMYEGSQTFRSIPMDSGGQGKAMDQPYFVTGGGSVSYNFKAGWERAVRQSVGPGFTAAKFGWDNMYAHWAMDTKQRKQMPGRGKGSYIGAVRQMIDRTKYRIGQRRLKQIFEDGNGSLGQISGTAATAEGTNTVTGRRFRLKLAQHTHTIYFQRDTQFNVATSSTATTAVRAGTVATDLIFQVTDIDRSKNEIVVKSVKDDGTDGAAAGTTTANLAAALAANNWLFEKGDLVNIATQGPDGLSPYGATRVMPGFAAWCPKTLTSTDNFFGINRNQDRVFLAGVYHSQGSFDTEKVYQNTLLSAAYMQTALGGRISSVVMNPLHFRDFVFELDKTNTRYNKIDMQGSAKGVPGFKAIEIAHNKVNVKVHTDLHCPPGDAWGYVPSDWKICSLDEFIHTWQDDGRIVDRIQGEPKVAGSIQSYATMICKNPRNLARIALPNLRFDVA